MATTRVQSVTRAFSILNAFDKQRTTLTSTEIAASQIALKLTFPFPVS